MTPSALDSRARLLLERSERDAAAALVIERMTPGILGYLRTQLIEEDAQDALSLWREAIWTSLETFEWRSSVRAWAFRIARHIAARAGGARCPSTAEQSGDRRPPRPAVTACAGRR